MYFSAKVCQGEWNFVYYLLVELVIYVFVTVKHYVIYSDS